MLYNYFKAAFRNIKKKKIHSVINLLSLCVGITCCILIYMYVKHGLSYDDFFDRADQIYRLEFIAQHGEKLATRYANISSHENPGNINSISGIKNQSRFAILSSIYVQTKGKKIVEPHFIEADNHFFSLFSLPLIKGNRKTVLNEPGSIVISKKIARKYFENQEAVGRILTLSQSGKKTEVTVTGIMDNLPSNTHLQFDAVTSSSVSEELYDRSLSDMFVAYTYLMLGNNQNPKDIQAQLIQRSKKNHPNPIDYKLQPLTDIHLHSSARYEIKSNSNIRYIYFLIAIGIILLIITSINFTSLSTAQVLNRYTEAGVRKVLGAQKGQLITQFLFEAVLFALISLAFSYLAIYLLLLQFNTLMGISFILSDFLNPKSFTFFLSISLGIGILAALYPAIILSAFQPVKTLKGIAPSGRKGSALWKWIVVIQFAGSIAMIIGTVTIYRQLSYIQNKDLGFNKDHVVTFLNPDGMHYKPLHSQIQSIPGVQKVTISSFIPGINNTGGTGRVQAEGRSDTLIFHWVSVDYNYFDTYDVKLAKGRFFSPDRGTDSTEAFIINQAAVNVLGWESPLGKKIEAFGRKGKVIGVTKNFNFLSLYQNYTPLIFLINSSLYFNFSVRLSPQANVSEMISKIRNTWQEINPDTPFKYSFVDAKFDTLYKSDQRMGRFFGILAILALFVACLGLFSLSSFTATQKRKEIGIRKVLGASTSNILLTFYQKYIQLIFIAALIAVPASYYFLSDWLQNFAFRISIGGWIFLLAVMSTTIIAILAVSYESIKAAFANPVEALKSE